MRVDSASIGSRPERTHGSSGRHQPLWTTDRKSTRLNSSHLVISYAVFCLKKKKKQQQKQLARTKHQTTDTKPPCHLINTPQPPKKEQAATDLSQTIAPLIPTSPITRSASQ